MTSKFKGTISLDIRDSKPDWSPYMLPTAPKGARVERLSLPRTFPLSLTTAETMLVPPRSTPMTVLNSSSRNSVFRNR